MLKKIFLGILSLVIFWVIISYACGCAGQKIIISQPPYPAVIVVQSEKPMVVPADSLAAELDSLNAAPNIGEILLEPFREYLPDPCKGIIKNYSSGGLIMWVWLNNSPPDAEPAFKLLSQEAKTIYAPIGVLKVYARAFQKTAYGWRSVGAYSLEQRIAPYAYNTGDFNWRVYLSDWNFPGMR